MRLFLFAIGGTGARVVRSLTMMLSAGIEGMDSSTEIVPIIIDYDLTNGDKDRALKTMHSYCSLHGQLYPDSLRGTNYDHHFFMTRMTPLAAVGTAPMGGTPMLDFEFNFHPTGGGQKFSEYMNINAMNIIPDVRMTGDLMHALYDDSDAQSRSAELELDMIKGFKGNPNIGSVVFHELRSRPEFLRFAGAFNAAMGDKVFVVSSIFGGTGASGLPEIVNAIRTSNLVNLQNAVIGAALVMPYFGLQPYDPSTGDTGAIDAASFNAKARAALLHYAQNNGLNSRVNSLYYVGDNNRDLYKYSEGESRQKNESHVVEFVAASAVVDFLVNRANTKITDHDPYEFGIAESKVETKIELPDFFPSSQSLIMDNLSAFAIAMKYYRDVVCGDRNKVSSNTAYYKQGRFDLAGKLRHGVYQELDTYLLDEDWGFYRWLNELASGAHSHKLAPYQLDKTKEMKEVLSHKTITSASKLGQNPIKDDVLSEEINKKSQNLSVYNATSFLKVLHDVAIEKYEKVK